MSIALESLTKTYPGNVHALRTLSLEIATGEFFVILGPSGCGKTTTLRLIAGLDHPTSGEIHFDGNRVTKMRPAKRNVGFVFQQPVLYPHMTVERNLAFVLRNERMTQAEREHRIRETARLCHIEPLLQRRPGELSVGEQQRVSLARNVLRRPTCLLLDEPLAALDAPLRAIMRREIRNVHDAHSLTSIFVTHDQDEAFALADRVALLKEGELQQVAPPMELYRDPANAFVATFIGSPGMNLIPGHVQQHSDAIMFSAGGSLRTPMPPSLKPGEQSEMTLGIRPEHISLHEVPGDQSDQAASLEVIVASVERFGDHMILHVHTRDRRALVIKTRSADGVKPGNTVRACIPFSACCYFEPGLTGRRIDQV